jgi:hypothetical protein
MASAEVATAKAKAAKAINLIISFLPCEPGKQKASERRMIGG